MTPHRDLSAEDNRHNATSASGHAARPVIPAIAQAPLVQVEFTGAPWPADHAARLAAIAAHKEVIERLIAGLRAYSWPVTPAPADAEAHDDEVGNRCRGADS